MTILHLSDTHGKHRELTDMPSADILVHSGDFTMAGGDMEALDFIEWLCDLPYKHKIFIAGNHDDCMLDATLEGLPDDVHYLSDNGITIDGISFYGTPMFVTFEDEDLKEIEHYEQIPDNIDILITHALLLVFWTVSMTNCITAVPFYWIRSLKSNPRCTYSDTFMPHTGQLTGKE